MVCVDFGDYSIFLFKSLVIFLHVGFDWSEFVAHFVNVILFIIEFVLKLSILSANVAYFIGKPSIYGFFIEYFFLEVADIAFQAEYLCSHFIDFFITFGVLIDFFLECIDWKLQLAYFLIFIVELVD